MISLAICGHAYGQGWALVALARLLEDSALADEAIGHFAVVGSLMRLGFTPLPGSNPGASAFLYRAACRGPSVLTAGSGLGPVEVDERDPEIGVHHLAQLRGVFGHDDLQRREHLSFDEVASARTRGVG